jgi:GNAT superfamily N-acetyltransferase
MAAVGSLPARLEWRLVELERSCRGKRSVLRPTIGKSRLELPLMLSIRAATVDDVALLKSLICELAEYERERDQVVITEADLARDGFGPEPKFRALIAEWDEQPAGYALFFGFYSTWEGRPGLFLEDLFVRQGFRGQGIGKALLRKVAAIAQHENCYGMRWEVLDWNHPAIEFYKRLGAAFLDQWKSVLLTGEALERAGEAQ